MVLPEEKKLPNSKAQLLVLLQDSYSIFWLQGRQSALTGRDNRRNPQVRGRYRGDVSDVLEGEAVRKSLSNTYRSCGGVDGCRDAKEAPQGLGFLGLLLLLLLLIIVVLLSLAFL